MAALNNLACSRRLAHSQVTADAELLKTSNGRCRECQAADFRCNSLSSIFLSQAIMAMSAHGIAVPSSSRPQTSARLRLNLNAI